MSYVLERSSDVAAATNGWQTVATLYGYGGVMKFTDTTATNPVQFYRVRLQ